VTAARTVRPIQVVGADYIEADARTLFMRAEGARARLLSIAKFWTYTAGVLVALVIALLVFKLPSW
jgi:hypothetical protein